MVLLLSGWENINKKFTKQQVLLRTGGQPENIRALATPHHCGFKRLYIVAMQKLGFFAIPFHQMVALVHQIFRAAFA